ncbi:MAG: hypothetical protein K2Z81_19330, partial [Cyanobacteria bacterium]|nr:hypothetical protein [Cyanobacteriota bacterium]
MQSAFEASTTRFALDLFGRAYDNSVKETDAKKKQVVQLSPYSIRRAILMTALGAHGKTRRKVREALCYASGTDLRDVHADNLKVANWLTTVEAKSKAPTKLAIANALWMKDEDGLEFQPSFVQDNSEFYKAEATKLLFDSKAIDRINSWCDTNTNHKISRIIEEIPEEALLFLTDALYML